MKNGKKSEIPEHGGNEFTIYYLDIILERDDRKLRRKVILKDPELAIRIFSVFGHQTLGKEFVKEYDGSEDYHHSAYFISRELGIEIERRNFPNHSLPYIAIGEVGQIFYDSHQRGMSIARANKNRVNRSAG